MSFEIDPREVLEHLEYLGYSTISKEQLKDFIRDLKKLIKYEQNKERSVLNKGKESQDKVSVACETSIPFVVPGIYSNYEAPTSPLSNVEHFSGQFQDSPQPKSVTPNLQRSYHSQDYDVQNKPEEQICITCCKQCCEKNCVKKECCGERQPCPSFIRPGMSKPSKCDPVALYHYYQNQWSKRPLPGEDPRTDLRWAVRTRLAQQKQQQQQALLRKTTSMDGVLHRKKFQI